MSTIKIATKKAESVQGAQVANNGTTANTEKLNTLEANFKKFMPEPFKTPEERILRAQQFEALSKRYEALKRKHHELQTFKSGNDKIGAKMSLVNNSNFEFTITNSNVIEKLIEVSEKELSILLEDTKNEVLTFEM